MLTGFGLCQSLNHDQTTLDAVERIWFESLVKLRHSKTGSQFVRFIYALPISVKYARCGQVVASVESRRPIYLKRRADVHSLSVFNARHKALTGWLT